MTLVKVLEPISLNDFEIIHEFKEKYAYLDFTIEEKDTRFFQPEELIEFIKDADALIICNRPLSGQIIDACPYLRFISVAFTGIDHIDQDACKRKNIAVKNSANYSTHSVAELTICLALNLSRKILQVKENMVQKPVEVLLGHELYEKSIGIIGAGAIGLETARLFQAFGANIMIYNRHPVFTRFEATQVSLETLLSSSDIVSLHIPLTLETTHFINEEKLQMMKRSSFLINTARGAIVDQEALIKALEYKWISGAALDVFDQEPPLPKDFPLLNHEKIITTPHIGFRTEEAFSRRAEIAFQNLADWLLSI